MDNMREVMRIKDIIERLKTDKAKKMGVLEQIKQGWMDKYGTDDIDEIKAILTDLKHYRKIDEDKLDSIYNKLTNDIDWEQAERELA